MSSNVRSYFRNNRSCSNDINITQRQNSKEILSPNTTTRLTNVVEQLSSELLLHDINEYLTSLNSQQQSINMSCCGNDEKKNATKSQIKAPRLTHETRELSAKKLVDSVESNDDHKVDHIAQQHAIKIDTQNDSLDKQELEKAIMNQVAQRALTTPVNVCNDDPPRICTKKHCSFANEPLTIKPVTCVPGIGSKHGDLCEKHGITMAHQLLSRYMIIANDEKFEKSLIDQLGFTPKSAAMTRDGLKEMRRHLI